jgi:broad specificity phosphatase PhoE
MLTIKLVRHGESLANTGEVNPRDIGDHVVPLSPHGHAQARQTGQLIGREFLEQALIYVSPYRRTRETLDGVLAGASLAPPELVGLRAHEDPRLREVEHGYELVEPQEELRKTHGWFFYRFKGGESPADCYDRTCTFLESMMRQVERKGSERALIVTHGLTIRCFVMRFLHLTVEQFDSLARNLSTNTRHRISEFRVQPPVSQRRRGRPEPVNEYETPDFGV